MYVAASDLETFRNIDTKASRILVKNPRCALGGSRSLINDCSSGDNRNLAKNSSKFSKASSI